MREKFENYSNHSESSSIPPSGTSEENLVKSTETEVNVENDSFDQEMTPGDGDMETGDEQAEHLVQRAEDALGELEEMHSLRLEQFPDNVRERVTGEKRSRMIRKLKRVALVATVAVSSFLQVGCGSEESEGQLEDPSQTEVVETQSESDGVEPEQAVEHARQLIMEDSRALVDGINSGEIDFDELNSLAYYNSVMEGSGDHPMQYSDTHLSTTMHQALQQGLQQRALKTALGRYPSFKTLILPSIILHFAWQRQPVPYLGRYVSA